METAGVRNDLRPSVMRKETSKQASSRGQIITLRVRRSRGEMYSSDHGRLCVYLSVPRCTPTLLHGPGCKLGGMVGVPCSCALLGGFTSVDGYRCYDIIALNVKCQRVLVLALCLVKFSH